MSNYDENTGISYGVISPNAISGESLNYIYDMGTDPHYENAKEEITSRINDLLDDITYIKETKDAIRDEILEVWNDNFDSSCGDGQCDYSDKEYTLHVSGDNFGIFVIKSPYYTYCRKCSPCAPGAGDLNNPVDPVNLDLAMLEHISAKTLCLGTEWFDQSDEQYARKIPYRVFRVEDDQEVV